MNQVYNTFFIKTLPFVTINDINNYRIMTRTSQAYYIAELISNYLKIIDKHNVIYYNTINKLWILMTESQYVNLITNILNETIKIIKLIKRRDGEDLTEETIKVGRNLILLACNR